MVANAFARIVAAARGGALSLGLVGLLACATTSAPAAAPAAGGTLSKVTVESADPSTIVRLKGVGDATYTAFRAEDPPRLIVDLPGVEASGVPANTPVYDARVDEVNVASFPAGEGGPATRVELVLADAKSDYRIDSAGDGLEVRVEAASSSSGAATTAVSDASGTAQEEGASAEARGEAAAAPAPTSGDPNRQAAEALGTDEPSDAAEPGTQAEPAPVEGEGSKAASLESHTPQAHLLAGLEVEPSRGGAEVRIQLDGRLSDVRSFTLDDPPRLVIDLPGLRESHAPAQIAVDNDYIRRVRVGHHPDKIRVVLDAGSAERVFDGYRVVPVADGLVVALGSNALAVDVASVQPQDETEAAVASTSASMPEAAEEQDEAPGSASAAAADATSARASTQTAASEPPAADEQSASTESVRDAQEASGEAMPEERSPEGAGEASGSSEIAEAETSPPSPAHENDAEGEQTVHVYGVEVDAQPTRDRVVISADRAFHYDLLSPDPGTLVVSIPRATIDSEKHGRMAMPEGSAIHLVSAFAQPDVTPPEVRVVVERDPGFVPEVSTVGGTLVLDFPRPQAEAQAAEASASRTQAEEPAATQPDSASGPQAAAAPVPAVKAAAQAMAKAAAAPQATKASAAVPASIEPANPAAAVQPGGMLEGKKYVGRRISLDFKDVDIQDVLRLIADVSDLNIIAGDDVKGKVTIRLVDVPWDQALDVILLTKGLGFTRVGNVLRIAPADLLKQEEETRLQERRAKEKLEDLVLKLQPVNYADVKEIQTMVKRLLTPRGTVNIDKRTNTVIIKDIPSVVDEATALIKAIDTQTPQVMIEAKIVEANLDFSREIGSVWSIGTQPLTDGFDTSSDPRRDLGGQDFRFHDTNNVAVSNPITSLANGLLNLGAFLIDEKVNVSLQLQAAESNGEGKVISSPRVVTLDNRQAKIEQGVSIPFQTFENGDAKLEFIDAVLSLKVTPHITADRSIIMKVEVTRDAPDDSVQTPTGSPAIAKNQAKTETLVKDGQTLVIGGIYVINKSDRRSEVPWLGRVPLLGAAFRNREIRDIRKELLVFVTPRIVVAPERPS